MDEETGVEPSGNGWRSRLCNVDTNMRRRKRGHRDNSNRRKRYDGRRRVIAGKRERRRHAARFAIVHDWRRSGGNELAADAQVAVRCAQRRGRRGRRERRQHRDERDECRKPAEGATLHDEASLRAGRAERAVDRDEPAPIGVAAHHVRRL
ncbi:MAG TPA: hypothetical protein VII68_17505, partial [Casimicrobiaceae bacterium]